NGIMTPSQRSEPPIGLQWLGGESSHDQMSQSFSTHLGPPLEYSTLLNASRIASNTKLMTRSDRPAASAREGCPCRHSPQSATMVDVRIRPRGGWRPAIDLYDGLRASVTAQRANWVEVSPECDSGGTSDSRSQTQSIGNRGFGSRYPRAQGDRSRVDSPQPG